MDNKTATRMEDALKQNPDWSLVLKESERLGVQTLLYKHLSENSFGSYVPDEIMQNLQQNFRRQSMRSLRTYSLINRIANSMNSCNIPVILLKGAFLAKQIYKDIALRPMNDIDILCRNQDSSIIREKMAELGFYEQKPVYQSRFHEKAFPDADLGVIVPSAATDDRFYPFFNEKGNKVDIHFSLYDPQLIPGKKTADLQASIMEDVWKAATPFYLDGLTVYSLSPEDQLLHLTTHLYKHITPEYGGITLYWFCDIHELIKSNKDKTDWEKFCTKAEGLGAGSQTGTVLSLVKNYWDTPIPDRVLDRLGQGSENRSLEEIIYKKSDYRLHYAKIIKAAWKMDGWKNRLYFLMGFVFPTREYLISRYQLKKHSFVWIYYVIHPCILSVKAVRRLLRF
ncbi:MAG: nucleotidyltransferase family protein [Desulfobacteraceae bacterium]|nr:nucleotidyltransferase family protein [Desulfobacteraceae bacterium]